MRNRSVIITVSLNPAIDRVLEVEDFTFGAHQPARELSRTPAGKAINVSRVLAALDARSVATGFLGSENRSSYDPLFRDGRISDEFFLLPGRTRENVTIVDRTSGRETHLRDVGLKVERRYLDRLAKKLGLLSRADCIVIFSGSLPPGAEPADLVQLVQVCASAGARVAVDTSGEALRAMAGRPLWLLKPNAAELAALTGRELGSLPEHLDAARELAARVDVVLFTRGEQGAYLFTGELALHAVAPVPAELIRNTVGCGDVLLGTFVAGVCRGRDLRQCLRDAVAFATASACDVATAQFGPELAEKLKDQVQLTDV